MKNLILRIITSLLMILTLLFNVSLLAFAQENARLYLQQVEANNDTLTVEVMVDNVADLYGVQFDVTYDPAVIAVQDMNPETAGIQVEPGTLLPAESGKSFVVANKVDEAAGKITFAMTLLNPTPAVSGSGALARITLKKLQPAPTEINVAYAKLVSDKLQTIPSETASLSLGGSEEQAAAPAAPAPPPAAGTGSDFPWWIIAVVIMFLGVMLLAGLIVIGGRSRSAAQQPAKPQRPDRPSGSRPSAFKQQNLPSPDMSQNQQQFRSS